MDLNKTAPRRESLLSHPASRYKMAGNHLRHLTPLKDLSPLKKVYQGINEDGRVWLRSSLIYHDTPNIFNVTERHLVALALTEVCCEQGKGKVIIDSRAILMIN